MITILTRFSFKSLDSCVSNIRQLTWLLEQFELEIFV